MNTLTEQIQQAIALPAGKRDKALKGIRWRLRYGLLYAGLDGINCILVSKDDHRCQIFNGRDNEQIKARFYGAVLRCHFDTELL